jgi:hypothetical protein
VHAHSLSKASSELYVYHQYFFPRGDLRTLQLWLPNGSPPQPLMSMLQALLSNYPHGLLL